MSVRKSIFGQKDVYVSSERINLDAPVVVNSGGVDQFVHTASQPTTAASTNLLNLATRNLISSSNGYNAFILGLSVDNLSLVRASLDGTRTINTEFQVSFTATAEAAGTMLRSIQFLVNGVVVVEETTENPQIRASAYQIKKSAKLLLKDGDVVIIRLASSGAPVGSAISNLVITAFY